MLIHIDSTFRYPVKDMVSFIFVLSQPIAKPESLSDRPAFIFVLSASYETYPILSIYTMIQFIIPFFKTIVNGFVRIFINIFSVHFLKGTKIETLF